MLRLLKGAGARRVIATPHIYPGRFDNEPGPLRDAFAQLDEARANAGIDIEIELGAEHYCDDSLPARIERRDILPFGPERYVLFETPTGEHPPASLHAVISALTRGGFTPLMAHVERYQYLRTEEGLELLEDLRCIGVKFQVNRTVGQANIPGQGPRGKFLAILLARGWVDEVGSDLHRPTPDGRPYRDDERLPMDSRQ